jgi:hypothetical protein
MSWKLAWAKGKEGGPWLIDETANGADGFVQVGLQGRIRSSDCRTFILRELLRHRNVHQSRHSGFRESTKTDDLQPASHSCGTRTRLRLGGHGRSAVYPP